MKILGIETTCDETAAGIVQGAVLDVRAKILSNVIYSQSAEHAPFGGVMPEIAARAHLEHIDGIVTRSLAEAGLAFEDLDAIAAAGGPGLIVGVMIGLTFGKTLALGLRKPFVAVNHLEAHALTARLTDGIAFPYLLLLASGGHTQLVAVKGVGDYKLLGSTRDDALGEAFDKCAKMLGLPYPGGAALERLAEGGDGTRFALPRPMLGRTEPDFSLSGLKTAVRQLIRAHEPLSEQDKADVAASFQAAVVDMVIDRTRVGLRHFRAVCGLPTALVVAGGVASNFAIRRALERMCRETGLPMVAPEPILCTDNGAMIAYAGLERLRLGFSSGYDFAPRARWPLEAC